jgi:site-specific recombinase XerC
MPTVIERNGKFVVRVRRKGMPSVAKTFIRRRDAVSWGRQVEADMEAGRWIDPRRKVPTLKDALIEYRKVVGISHKGNACYSSIYKEIDLALGRYAVDQIKPNDLAAWRDQMLGNGRKPGTVMRKLSLLSGVLTWCFKEKGWITGNPMWAIRRPTVRDSRTRTLSPQEVSYLQVACQAARARWLQDAVQVQIGTAMRRSELVLRCPRGFVERRSRVRSTRDGDRTDEEAIHRGTDHWLPA